MIAHEMSDLGQLRVAGRDIDFYVGPSQRPYPAMSEEELIDKGIIRNTEPVWGRLLWPGWKVPPSIPSSENEVFQIRREMGKTLWPKAGPWNLNYQEGRPGTLTPPTPDNLGDFEHKHIFLASVFVILYSSLAAAAIVRGIAKEEKTFWQIMLGFGLMTHIMLIFGSIVLMVDKDAGKK